MALGLLAVCCAILVALVVVERRQREHVEGALGDCQRQLLRLSGITPNSPAFERAYLDEIWITTLPAVDYREIFDKRHLLEDSISNWDEMVAACQRRFAMFDPVLREQWRIDDTPTLTALFHLNLVSRLWGYGNPDPADSQGGCVYLNSSTGFKPRIPQGPPDYLRSEIGCCCDHAFILKILLDGSGIPNRKVSFGDFHVFNEALVGGRWNVLDATLGFWYHASWEEIQTRPEGSSFRVTVFPHLNLVEPDNPSYRPAIGRLRLEWLLRAAKKTAYPVTYSADNSPCNS